MTDKTGVFKHQILVTVLAESDDISLCDLIDLAYEMNEGEFMGTYDIIDISPELTLNELVEEATNIGGEASFFNEDFDNG
jgi:hypothetical protein